jgi:scyllo-inositol 2-dehydrogenase (NADP+)
MEFDDSLFQVESSRVCRLDRPRWWIVGTEGGFVKRGIDPQEDALRAGNIDTATEPAAHQGVLRTASEDGSVRESPVATIRGHWDSYYSNIVDAIHGRQELAVTAEQAREVVRVLDAAVQSSEERSVIDVAKRSARG